MRLSEWMARRAPVEGERESVDWLETACLLKAVYGLNLYDLTTFQAMFYLAGLPRVVELTRGI
jgi:hypothetical protein